ncbi:MAG: 2-succinyl-5-enolpyruvyl-6-hydroxy-3-cyclohexene-1-carboxylic-acid synthase [bacterium]|nr:2-succinyl-5-enolpyruvyl-6-hydroxy-3-cyclohexene-1-carboxylic-acid synthase [bacterium]
MTAYDYYGTFFEELATQGVYHAVCSPGARCAPLVLAADAEPRLRCWVQIDERAAGFFALGLAKAQRACVALISTSGSAAANYLTALTEAFYDGVALVALTADRPPELRDRGAGQTIDQIRLYGGHVRWSADLPVPDEVAPEHARYVARRAVAAATGPPGGPVHLNVPLREPLEPPGNPPASAGASSARRAEHPAAAAYPSEAASLARLVQSRAKGLLAVGPSDLRPADAAAVKRLAALAGWPVIADAASGLRSGAPEGAAVIAAGHHLACSPSFWEAHRPEVIVRTGHPTAGRALREGLAAWGSETWLVDSADRWEEPTAVAAGLWRSPIGALARGAADVLGAGNATGAANTAGRSEPSWARSWRDAEAAAQQAITASLAEGTLLEAGLARSLGGMLEGAAALYVSNSMPVRDLDAFLAPHPRVPRVMAHRGTNGIDGVVSAAAGAAALGSPVVLLAGDLALLHDLGGLLAAGRLGVDLTVVVANNDGGGIFSFLPIAATIPRATFERYFLTPHGTEWSAVLAGLGIRHRRVGDRAELREALDAATKTAGVDVIEVPVDSAANVAQHRAVEQAVRAALAGAVPRE